MIYLKKIVKALIYTFSIMIIGTVLLTLFSYLSEGIIFKFIKIIIPLISLLIGGIIIGKSSKNKGWFEGLKYGIIVVLIMLILSLILPNNSLNITRLIYYMVLIFMSITGSMIGINKTIDKN